METAKLSNSFPTSDNYHTARQSCASYASVGAGDVRSTRLRGRNRRRGFNGYQSAKVDPLPILDTFLCVLSVIVSLIGDTSPNLLLIPRFLKRIMSHSRDILGARVPLQYAHLGLVFCNKHYARYAHRFKISTYFDISRPKHCSAHWARGEDDVWGKSNDIYSFLPPIRRLFGNIYKNVSP